MLDKVQEIKFKGVDYILSTPDESDSPITTIETYKKGECSYAHYWSEDEGSIMRFYEQIGTTKDIEFGEFIEIEIDILEFAQGMLGDTWSVNRAKSNTTNSN